MSVPEDPVEMTDEESNVSMEKEQPLIGRPHLNDI